MPEVGGVLVFEEPEGGLIVYGDSEEGLIDVGESAGEAADAIASGKRKEKIQLL